MSVVTDDRIVRLRMECLELANARHVGGSVRRLQSRFAGLSDRDGRLEWEHFTAQGILV